MRLKDKTAIITGGGTGIGLATAHAFYQEGAKIILFGRRKEKLEKAVEKLGESAIIVQGDMTNNDDLDQLVKIVIICHVPLNNNCRFTQFFDCFFEFFLSTTK